MNNLLKQLYDTQSQQSVAPLHWIPKGAALYGSDYQAITSPLYVSGQNIIGRVKNMTESESLAILSKAQKAWNNRSGVRPTMSRLERIRAMERFIEMMMREKDVIIELLMLEIGKNKTDAQTEFDRTITYTKDTIAEYADDTKFGNYKQSASGFVSTNEHQPLGVTLCFSPFNYPLNETFTTMIPALLTGNPIILKPAKHGVLFWRYLQKHMNACFPDGVANIITGDGPTIVTPLMQSGHIDVLAFIGGEKAANAIAANHPRSNRLEKVLGLGAKNASVITQTADIAKAIMDNLKGALSYNGQRCTAHKLLFVHEDIYDAFVS